MTGVIAEQQWEPIVVVNVSFAFPSPGWTPLCLYRLRLDHPGLRRIWTTPEGFCHPRGPYGATSGNAPNAYPKPGLNTRDFTTQAPPLDACFVGAWPPAIVGRGALPHGQPLPCLGHKAWTPLCFNHPGFNICARLT
jgi:hypothetical protein